MSRLDNIVVTTVVNRLLELAPDRYAAKIERSIQEQHVCVCVCVSGVHESSPGFLYQVCDCTEKRERKRMNQRLVTHHQTQFDESTVNE